MTRTIEEQTGYLRICPTAICQYAEILLAVTEYDYDLHNQEFNAYCRMRIGVTGHGAQDPRWFDCLCRHDMTQSEFYEMWRVVGEYGHQSNVGKVLSDNELRIKWEIYRIQKGRFQDCWELFSEKKR